MSKVTNLQRATEIVKEAITSGTQKKAVLETLVTELGITRSNAFVYYTKATKALGSAGTPPQEKVAKVVKAVKVNPITELSGEKAKKKLSEIDSFIAKVKASGQASNPFGALV